MNRLKSDRLINIFLMTYIQTEILFNKLTIKTHFDKKN